MRYWLLTLVGLTLAGASIVAVNWGLYHLVRTGTCASGGPYELARPCPEGTGLHVAALFAGTFAGLIGIGLWAARGLRGTHSRVGLGAIMWALLFCTLAGSAALAAFGPAHSDDNEGAVIAAITLAVIFIPMGLAPVIMSAAFGDWHPRGKRFAGAGTTTPPKVMSRIIPAPSQPPTPGGWTGWKPVPQQGDAAQRLAQLAEMRDKGLITGAEFEQQKQRILGGL